MRSGTSSPINLSKVWGLSKFNNSGKPWLSKMIIDFKKELITIEKTPEKNGNVDLLWLEPSRSDQKKCLVGSGYRAKNGENFYEREIGTIDVSFKDIPIFLQPLIGLLN